MSYKLCYAENIMPDLTPLIPAPILAHLSEGAHVVIRNKSHHPHQHYELAIEASQLTLAWREPHIRLHATLNLSTMVYTQDKRQAPLSQTESFFDKLRVIAHDLEMNRATLIVHQ